MEFVPHFQFANLSQDLLYKELEQRHFSSDLLKRKLYQEMNNTKFPIYWEKQLPKLVWKRIYQLLGFTIAYKTVRLLCKSLSALFTSCRFTNIHVDYNKDQQNLPSYQSRLHLATFVHMDASHFDSIPLSAEYIYIDWEIPLTADNISRLLLLPKLKGIILEHSIRPSRTGIPPELFIDVGPNIDAEKEYKQLLRIGTCHEPTTLGKLSACPNILRTTVHYTSKIITNLGFQFPPTLERLGINFHRFYGDHQDIQESDFHILWNKIGSLTKLNYLTFINVKTFYSPASKISEITVLRIENIIGDIVIDISNFTDLEEIVFTLTSAHTVRFKGYNKNVVRVLLDSDQFSVMYVYALETFVLSLCRSCPRLHTICIRDEISDLALQRLREITRDCIHIIVRVDHDDYEYKPTESFYNRRSIMFRDKQLEIKNTGIVSLRKTPSKYEITNFILQKHYFYKYDQKELYYSIKSYLSSKVNWKDNLLDVLWWSVFTFLTLPERFSGLRRVCKRFHKIVCKYPYNHNHLLWRFNTETFTQLQKFTTNNNSFHINEGSYFEHINSKNVSFVSTSIKVKIPKTFIDSHETCQFATEFDRHIPASRYLGLMGVDFNFLLRRIRENLPFQNLVHLQVRNRKKNLPMKMSLICPNLRILDTSVVDASTTKWIKDLPNSIEIMRVSIRIKLSITFWKRLSKLPRLSTLIVKMEMSASDDDFNTKGIVLPKIRDLTLIPNNYNQPQHSSVCCVDLSTMPNLKNFGLDYRVRRTSHVAFNLSGIRLEIVYLTLRPTGKSGRILEALCEKIDYPCVIKLDAYKNKVLLPRIHKPITFIEERFRMPHLLRFSYQDILRT